MNRQSTCFNSVRLIIFYSLGEKRFSSYHFTYEFQSTYQLQTPVSTLNFRHTNGTELDCGVVKITPDIGKSASLAFSLTPLCLLAFIALVSVRQHLGGIHFRHFLDDESVLATQGPVWATVLDITVFLRHLQFIFLSASMTVEYPGFYVPIISKLAWASLLFWRGPLNHGHSSPGIDGGMYVSNATYGPDFMNQMLGYPNMLNTLGNSVINLFILLLPTFFLLSFLFVVTSATPPAGARPFWSITKKAAGMTIGLGLCFFSVPLLSYMAYDLILIGYLPNYRIALAVFMLLLVVGAHHFLTYHVDNQVQTVRIPVDDDDIGPDHFTPNIRNVLKKFYRHLQHSFPLFQAIGVGSLQDHPLAQVSILAGCEIGALVHAIFRVDEPFFALATTYCTFMRLITALLSIAFTSSVTETTKQWIGYAILALHGFVVLPGFFVKTSWQLHRTPFDHAGIGRVSRDTSSSAISSVRYEASLPEGISRVLTQFLQHVALNTLASPSSAHLTVYREEPATGAHRQPLEQDISYFYRAPRSRTTTPISETPQRMTHSDSPSTVSSDATDSVEDIRFNMNSVLSLVSPTDGVDYSVREVDLYYGMPVEENNSGSPTPSISGPSSASGIRESSGHGRPSSRLDFKSALSLGRLKRKEPEKGFEVVRPRRPPPQP